MKLISQRILMISGVALMTGAMAFAQGRPGGSTSPTSSPTNASPNSSAENADMNSDQMERASMEAMRDKDFVREALQGGMAEVQLGQLAAQKGSSADVRQFGQKMVDDHTKLGDQMKQTAQQLGVKEPKDLTKKDKQLVAKLQTLSGEQFDDAYIEAMVKDHKKDFSDFTHEAGSTQNSGLKQATQQDAQIIDGHLQMVEQIAKAHGVKE